MKNPQNLTQKITKKFPLFFLLLFSGTLAIAATETLEELTSVETATEAVEILENFLTENPKNPEEISPENKEKILETTAEILNTNNTQNTKKTETLLQSVETEKITQKTAETLNTEEKNILMETAETAKKLEILTTEPEKMLNFLEENISATSQTAQNELVLHSSEEKLGEIASLLKEHNALEKQMENLETEKQKTELLQENTSSETQKNSLETEKEKTEEKMVQTEQNQLKILEKINEHFAENLENSVQEIFVETATTAEEKKNEEKKVEILEEKNLMEAPVLYSMFNSQTSILNTAENSTSNVQLSTINTAEKENNSKSTIQNSKFLVAIIDTGMDTKHKDLAGIFWTSENCVDENGEKIAGGCQNGGWDFVENDSNPYDTKYAHATAVAGILANINSQSSIINTADNSASNAANNSKFKIDNSKLEIMALKACCSLDGFFEAQTISRAIKFAVNNGADAINLSFGGPTASKAIEEAIAYAEEKGVVVFSAAGNYATNNDERPMYPANWNQKYSNVVSVGATDETGNMTVFSNFGKKTVDIFAPGKDLITTLPNNQQGKVSGTSFSCPFVVGVWGS